MNANTVIVTANGNNTIDVEHHGIGAVLMVGNELGEDVRRAGMSISDIDALIDRLKTERDKATAEAERRIAAAVRILAGLGMDAAAVCGAIREGYIDPGTVLARRAAADRDGEASQSWQSA